MGIEDLWELVNFLFCSFCPASIASWAAASCGNESWPSSSSSPPGWWAWCARLGNFCIGFRYTTRRAAGTPSTFFVIEYWGPSHPRGSPEQPGLVWSWGQHACGQRTVGLLSGVCEDIAAPTKQVGWRPQMVVPVGSSHEWEVRTWVGKVLITGLLDSFIEKLGSLRTQCYSLLIKNSVSLGISDQ